MNEYERLLYGFLIMISVIVTLALFEFLLRKISDKECRNNKTFVKEFPGGRIKIAAEGNNPPYKTKSIIPFIQKKERLK